MASTNEAPLSVAEAPGLVVAIQAALFQGTLAFFDDFENGASPPTDFFDWNNTSRVSSDRGFTGTKSLKFTFSGTVNSTAWSEQRFKLLQNVTELWMQYYVYVPENYYHRSRSSDSGKKMHVFYSDGYSITNGESYPTWIVGAHPGELSAINGVPGASYIDTQFQWRDPERELDDRIFSGQRAWDVNKMLVDPAVDRGHWQRRTMMVRLPVNAESNDGEMGFWVQRQAETATPMPEEKLMEDLTLSWYDPNHPYINGGYLLGYSNAGFEETTILYIDNVSVGNSAAAIGREDLL